MGEDFHLIAGVAEFIERLLPLFLSRVILSLNLFNLWQIGDFELKFLFSLLKLGA